MLNSEKTLFALNDVKDSHLESARTRLGYRVGRARPRVRRIVTLALAAALILSLSAAAYAANLFGIKALLLEKPAPADQPGVGYLSITQPQAVPDGMDSAVREKIENSTKAWAEWTAWKGENGLHFPAVYEAPEGVSFFSEDENPDGTYTIRFYAYPDVRPEDTSLWWEHIEQGDYSDFILLDERIATREEHDMNMLVSEAKSMGFRGYDFRYGVETQEMANALESIAARYGLKLRHESRQLYQNFGDQTGFLTREELTAKVNEIAGGGAAFFRTEPTGYDKFYYFDEGTFAVSFYTTEDTTNAGTSCYLYNSPYGTLSSGYEIIDEVQDIDAFTTRSHTAPDGTVLTVLQNGADLYAYVYLPDSFVTLHITQPQGLTETEIDAILDMVNYSTIG